MPGMFVSVHFAIYCYFIANDFFSPKNHMNLFGFCSCFYIFTVLITSIENLRSTNISSLCALFFGIRI